IIAPWLLLIVLAVARTRSPGAPPRSAMLFCALPSVVAYGVLAVNGRASTATATALEGASPSIIAGHGTVFPYLEDTFRSSFERVVHGPGNKPFSVIVGALFVGLLVYCGRGCIPYARAALDWILPT